MSENIKDVEKKCHEFRVTFEKLTAEVGKVIVGHSDIVNEVLIALFCGGHVLLEGVPGLGKTLLVRTLSDALSLEFSRVQFTPDLMPADIIGTNLLVEDKASGKRSFEFQNPRTSWDDRQRPWKNWHDQRRATSSTSRRLTPTKRQRLSTTESHLG